MKEQISQENLKKYYPASWLLLQTVYSAWDGNKLIGMICAMDDGIMNAYVHYLLVNPIYHGRTVGRTLVNMMKEHYKDYLRITVIAYDNELRF